VPREARTIALFNDLARRWPTTFLSERSFLASRRSLVGYLLLIYGKSPVPARKFRQQCPCPLGWTDVRFADESLDFIYLDADHSYESVKADLEAWYPNLWQGRLFAGDDCGALPLHEVNFGAGNLTFGVKKAVDEFATQRKKIISIDWLGDCGI